MTLAVEDRLHERMRSHREVKWSEVARKAFAEKLDELEFLDDIRSIKKAQREHRQAKTITHQEMKKRLGL